jgi:hypothetical protein
MNTLLHLCKKDFAYAKPWILGVWFTLVAGTFLPALIPAAGVPLPWAAIREWIPALLIFLTSTKIIHGDPFTGTTGFIATRPVRAVSLLGGKLAFISCILILPAASLALVHPALMSVELTATEHLLLFLEKALYFAVFAAAAVLVSVLTRRVGTMALLSAIMLIVIGSMVGLAFGRPVQSFGRTLEAQHLHASAWLVMQAFLMIAAIVIALSRAAKCRWPVTATMLVLAAAAFIGIGKGWKWNFVGHLAKDAPVGQILAAEPSLVWLDEPRLVSYEKRESIPYAQVIRPHRIEGLKDGWKAKLVESESEASFADGTVWKSHRASSPGSFEKFAADVLPQIGIELSDQQKLDPSDPLGFRVLFECEETRLLTLRERRASIHGSGTFQLYQPFIAAVMPAKAGATAVSGRSQFRIDSLSVIDGQISVSFSTRGVPLKSKGNGAGGFLSLDLILLNPATQQIAKFGGGGGSSRMGDDWENLNRSYRLDSKPGNSIKPDTDAFLKGARLYIIGTRHGGSIKLPYEIPEMLLEEKR